MSALIAIDQPSVGVCKARRPKQAGGKQPGGATLGQDQSRDARRLAAAILEVLAGARTPTEAATALSVSLPRYYQIESRALQGLVTACEAKPKGRTRSPERDLAALRQANERLQRDVTRQQALVRAAQRTMGLPPPPPVSTAAKSGKKLRKRRVARALSVAARLQQDQPAQPHGESSSSREREAVESL
jgi:uncharacterized protein (DUF2267 family)